MKRVAKLVYEILKSFKDLEKIGIIVYLGAIIGLIFLFSTPEAFETMAPFVVAILFVTGYFLLEFGRLFFPVVPEDKPSQEGDSPEKN